MSTSTPTSTDTAAGPRPRLRPPAPLQRVRRHLVTSFQPSVASDLRLHALFAAFYAYLAALALREMVAYRQLMAQEPVSPLWPVAWLRWVPHEPATVALVAALVASTLMGIAAYRRRWARVTVFVVLLAYAALLSSFGKINHGFHHLLIPAFFLTWAPDLPRAGVGLGDRHGPGPRLVPTQAYTAVLTTQAVLMLTYTLSGLFKLKAGVAQAMAGEPGLFSGASLASIVANRTFVTFDQPPLADLVVSHPLLSSLLYAGTVLVEVTALATVVVPRAAFGAAIALATFHLAVFWSMHINFTHSIATLVIVFLLSPFVTSARDGDRARVSPGATPSR